MWLRYCWLEVFQNNRRLSRQVLIVDDKRTASKIAIVFGNINLTSKEQFNWTIIGTPDPI